MIYPRRTYGRDHLAWLRPPCEPFSLIVIPLSRFLIDFSRVWTAEHTEPAHCVTAPPEIIGLGDAAGLPEDRTRPAPSTGYHGSQRCYSGTPAISASGRYLRRENASCRTPPRAPGYSVRSEHLSLQWRGTATDGR